MSFPTTSTVTLAVALQSLCDVANNVKILSSNIKTQSLTGLLTAPVILNYMAGLRSFRSRMAAVASTPGLQAYAQAQLGNTVDIAAEYTTMTSALDAAVAWVAANLPKDGSNYLLSQQIAGDGTITDRVFTSVSLAGFRTQLDALIATIG